VKGNPWALGNEYVSSVELGVEPVEGSGDIAVYDYKVSVDGSAPVSAPAAQAPVAPVATAAGCSASSNWVQGQQYAAGSVVSYAGQSYVAKFANPGYTPTISTYYWSPSVC
jgi:chitodextrinase